MAMISTVINSEDVSACHGAQVVVLDVLRATSTIVAALHAGAREVRLLATLQAAREARGHWSPDRGPVVLAGEERCVKPADFDLGNSPREHHGHHMAGASVLLATTNGTRAALRARQAAAQCLWIGSLLNATATAQALLPQLDQRDTVLVCAGTDGVTALEDVIGAGAILFALLQATYRTDLAFTDTSWIAYHTFVAVRHRLGAALRLGLGGMNVMAAGLEEDIDFCARMDALALAVAMDQTLDELVVRRIDICPGH